MRGTTQFYNTGKCSKITLTSFIKRQTLSKNPAPATCTNCRGTHPDNYLCCTTYKKALAKQRDNDLTAASRQAPRPGRRETASHHASSSRALIVAPATAVDQPSAAASVTVPTAAAVTQAPAGGPQKKAAPINKTRLIGGSSLKLYCLTSACRYKHQQRSALTRCLQGIA